jgi:hypothetical protein
MSQFRDPYAAPYPNYQTPYQDADDYNPYGGPQGQSQGYQSQAQYDPYGAAAAAIVGGSSQTLSPPRRQMTRGASSRTAVEKIETKDELDELPPVPWKGSGKGGAMLLRRTDTRQSLTAPASVYVFPILVFG